MDTCTFAAPTTDDLVTDWRMLGVMTVTPPSPTTIEAAMTSMIASIVCDTFRKRALGNFAFNVSDSVCIATVSVLDELCTNLAWSDKTEVSTEVQFHNASLDT